MVQKYDQFDAIVKIEGMPFFNRFTIIYERGSSREIS